MQHGPPFGFMATRSPITSERINTIIRGVYPVVLTTPATSQPLVFGFHLIKGPFSIIGEYNRPLAVANLGKMFRRENW
jgi:hypothetical protein